MQSPNLEQTSKAGLDVLEDVRLSIEDYEGEQRHRVLAALLEIANYVASDRGLEQILNRIVRVTAKTMLVQTSSIYLWNDDRTRLVMRSNVGFSQELIGKAGFDPGKGIPGWVAQHGKIIALADGTKDPRYDPLPTTLEHDYHAYLCAPLKIRDETIGVMTVRANEVREFDDDEITVYETICKQVSIVIEKARMHTAQVEAEKLAAVAVSISGIAHYIKNILVTMRGGEYLVDAGLKRGNLEQTAEGWGVLKRSNRKISALVENMLNYYRDTQLHPRPVDLNSLLLDILHDLEDRAIERDTVLTPDLDLRLDLVELDPNAIQDVMMNLIANGIDAIPEGRKGAVRVQSRLLPDEDQVLIAVSDNGGGVAPEDRDKLFNLFFSTKGKQGTGIGLSASRKMILDHGGTIDFESESGEGTVFTVRLPLRQGRR